eukprot:TRINITY_DN3941_c1_g1_i1.p1 TRINITY_DN3941_c1_g1~~TRINITY_DN3941_c1_g1_i1.p1  ORF type:complete len:226 (+),score=30.98 TRINITY_DN3941_c1_g1_i1:56-733(+)
MALTGEPTSVEMAISSPCCRLCIRHIPCKILESDFGDAMAAFRLDTYRYELYLPKRKGRKGQYNNFGYGFVTCGQKQDADAFARAFQGFRFQSVQSHKKLYIEPASRSSHSADFSASSSRSEVNFVLEMFAHTGAPSTYELASAFPEIASATMYTFAHMSAAEPLEWLSFESPPTGSGISRLKIPDACELPPTRLAQLAKPRMGILFDSGNGQRSALDQVAFCFQ